MALPGIPLGLSLPHTPSPTWRNKGGLKPITVACKSYICYSVIQSWSKNIPLELPLSRLEGFLALAGVEKSACTVCHMSCGSGTGKVPALTLATVTVIVYNSAFNSPGRHLTYRRPCEWMIVRYYLPFHYTTSRDTWKLCWNIQCIFDSVCEKIPTQYIG